MNKEQVENYITELESMFELSELEEHSRNILKVGIYINKLQQENKKYKKVIDKATEYIESKEYQYGDEEQDNYIYDIGFDEVNELLDILKVMK